MPLELTCETKTGKRAWKRAPVISCRLLDRSLPGTFASSKILLSDNTPHEIEVIVGARYSVSRFIAIGYENSPGGKLDNRHCRLRGVRQSLPHHPRLCLRARPTSPK